MNPVLSEGDRGRKSEGDGRTKWQKEKKNDAVTRGETGTRAGMSRLLVSQTRGRYLADQWQSTERPKNFMGLNLVSFDSIKKSFFRTEVMRRYAFLQINVTQTVKTSGRK
jgi:hypothetical protein